MPSSLKRDKPITHLFLRSCQLCLVVFSRFCALNNELGDYGGGLDRRFRPVVLPGWSQRPSLMFLVLRLSHCLGNSGVFFALLQPVHQDTLKSLQKVGASLHSVSG